jgi:hypothetical protein
MLKGSTEPSAEEVAEHCHTHLPFRSWCRFCDRRQLDELLHGRALTWEDRVLPELHRHVRCMGNEGEQHEAVETLPVLVVREVAPRSTMATTDPTKSAGTVVARRVAGYWLGTVRPDR